MRPELKRAEKSCKHSIGWKNGDQVMKYFDKGGIDDSQSAWGGAKKNPILKFIIKRVKLLKRKIASNKHRENWTIFSTYWCSVCCFERRQALLFFYVFLMYIAISRNMSYWQQDSAEKLSVYRLWVSESKGLLFLCPWHTTQAWLVFIK